MLINKLINFKKGVVFYCEKGCMGISKLASKWAGGADFKEKQVRL